MRSAPLDLDTAPGTVGQRSPAGAARAWLEPLLLALAAGLLYTMGLDRLPNPDELYHVLAAKGLLATGAPHIGDGLYTRVYLHTWLVAWCFRLLGESLWAARLVPLLAMAVLAGVLFAWLRQQAGRGAAWLGAGLFALSPFAVAAAQFSRFYALQSLSFFASGILAYAAFAPALAWRRRIGLLAGAVAAALLALYLQPTTLLGLAGVGLWAGCALLLAFLAHAPLARRTKLVLLAGAAAGLLLLVALAWDLGVAGLLVARFRTTPLFGAEYANEFWYYYAWYQTYYPTLWTLTGVLALAALATRPRPALFLLAVFVTGFALNSLAAQKNLRYLDYAEPFLFGLWGIGLAGLAPGLRRFAGVLVPQVRAGLGLRPLAAKLLVAAGLLTVLLANPAWVRTAMTVAGATAPGEVPDPDWPRAHAALAAHLRDDAVVVAVEELGPIYYYGRTDIVLSSSKLGELVEQGAEGEGDFTPDPRTGRPVIGSAAALGRVIACFPSGLVLSQPKNWGRSFQISQPMADLITAHAAPVPLPPRAYILAHAWRQPAGWQRPPDCAGLPEHFPPAPAAAP